MDSAIRFRWGQLKPGTLVISISEDTWRPRAIELVLDSAVTIESSVAGRVGIDPHASVTGLGVHSHCEVWEPDGNRVIIRSETA